MSRYPTFLPIFPCIIFLFFTFGRRSLHRLLDFEPVIKPFLLKNRKLMIEIRHAEMILFFRHEREKIRGAVVFFFSRVIFTSSYSIDRLGGSTCCNDGQ